MIPNTSVLRIARPTDQLDEITRMYLDGLGFSLLSEFSEHNGFNGSIIGHHLHPYHLEFTHHIGATVGPAPTQDNLLVFYIPEDDLWKEACIKMEGAGFNVVKPYNDYWSDVGKTFEDLARDASCNVAKATGIW